METKRVKKKKRIVKKKMTNKELNVLVEKLIVRVEELERRTFYVPYIPPYQLSTNPYPPYPNTPNFVEPYITWSSASQTKGV